MEVYGSFWPFCELLRLMSLSIVWSCITLWFDKGIPICIVDILGGVVEIEMVPLVFLRVVKVVCGACWGIWRLLGLIKLFQQALKERAKVGFLLDRFSILILATNDFLQCLFGCFFWNINLKGKLGFFD